MKSVIPTGYGSSGTVHVRDMPEPASDYFSEID